MRIATLANLLMLFLVTCWGTGMTQEIHEDVAHGEHSAVTPISAASESLGTGFNTAVPSHAVPLHIHSDDHDDCQVCASIAAMVAIVVVVILAMLLGRTLLARITWVQQRIRTHVRLLAISSRGPPAAAILCVA